MQIDMHYYGTYAKPRAATKLSVSRFYQAAAVYRIFILRVLLPSKGLVVT